MPTYNIIPLSKDKRCILSTWSHDHMNEYKQSPDGFYGMVCGPTSDYIMCIDVDCKYDETGTLWKEYSELIQDQTTILKEKCSIQKTMNKGYHIIFKCKTLISNLKLAEKKNKEVLIETRGKGGYFAIEPSPGYKIIHGDPENLPYLSAEEMNILLETAKVFNQLPEIKKERYSKEIDVSAFDDYNKIADPLDLLDKAGWKEAKTKGNAILLTRPGKSKGISASYLLNDKLFYVFTSSTEFENGKAYNPSQVYTILYHDGDYSEASKRLISEGYGSFKQTQKREIVNKSDCILPDNEGLDYLFDIRYNRVVMGLGFDIPKLDEHLKFKYNQYVLFVGNTNVGKTTVILYLLYKLAIRKNNDFRFLCYFAEDPVKRIKRNLSQFYIKKPISFQNDEEINNSNKWINQHFKFFDTNKRYSYVDILNVAEQVKKDWHYDSLLIDPYNSLKLDEQLTQNIRGWDYHVNASNEFQLWAHTKTGIILSAHTISSQQRLGSGSRPLLAHVEGGGMFSNKSDDGIIIHRMMDEERHRQTTQVHIDKIKDTFTGGMWTNSADPVQLWMKEDATGFTDSEPFNIRKIKNQAPF